MNPSEEPPYYTRAIMGLARNCEWFRDEPSSREQAVRMLADAHPRFIRRPFAALAFLLGVASGGAAEADPVVLCLLYTSPSPRDCS